MRTLLLAATLAAVAACAQASPPLPVPAAVPIPLAEPAALPLPLALLPEPASQAQGSAAGDGAAAENRGCEDCHTEIAAEWRGSLHHRSWDDPVFLTAYVIEPLAFCRACHVPEADPAQAPPEAARRLGIGCVTCHVRAGEVVGARDVRPSPLPDGGPSPPPDGGQLLSSGVTAGLARHAVRGDPSLATAAACARCHQFDFPQPQKALMQGTGDEHRASPYASSSCQQCHMPAVIGAAGKSHRSHDFRVIGDAVRLRSAVTARAWQAEEQTVVVSLATARVGHAFPTGDMFRRLEVRARVAGEGGEGGVKATPVVLARRFVMVPGPGGPQRKQTGDDRLPASGEAREVRLRFAEGLAGRAVRWEVVYQRMDAGMAATFGIDPAADEVIVAEGVLPPKRAGR
jgi:hypothetical protein